MPMDPDTKDEKDRGALPPSEEPVSAPPPAPADAAAAAAAEEPKKGHEHEDPRALRGKLKKRDHEIKDLKQKLDELRGEADGLKDRVLRLAAEMDNQRKRFEREKAEYTQYAQGDLLKELLAVIDNFERAIRTAAPAETSGFQVGVELIAKQLQDLVRRRGVTPVAAEGAKFDPAVHQAVLTEASEEVEEPMVGEELQKGYLLRDRLLRPALVKVLVPKNPS